MTLIIQYFESVAINSHENANATDKIQQNVHQKFHFCALFLLSVDKAINRFQFLIRSTVFDFTATLLLLIFGLTR